MKNWFTIARLAVLSLVCVVLSWIFFAAFVVSGTNHRLGNSMDKVAQFAVLSPSLIGIVLALASVIWNPRKRPGTVALVVAVVATCVLYWVGG